jgi:hypothetical protein
MLRFANRIRTAPKCMHGDSRRAHRVAALRSRARRRFILLCGAIALVLPWPAGHARAEPLVIEVAEANAGFYQNGDKPVVNVRLTPSSARLFGDFTVRHQGKVVEIRLDGRVVMKPRIMDPVFGGPVQISGSTTIAEARGLAAGLSHGAGKLEVEAASQ